MPKFPLRKLGPCPDSCNHRSRTSYCACCSLRGPQRTSLPYRPTVFRRCRLHLHIKPHSHFELSRSLQPDLGRSGRVKSSKERRQHKQCEVGQAKEHYEPLRLESTPWELRFDNFYGNIIYDPNACLYKPWYKPRSGRTMSICFAAYRIGTSLEKPNKRRLCMMGERMSKKEEQASVALIAT